MNKEDKELQKHLIDEMMKVYKTNPDVMIYMEALMKKYEEKEQEIDRLNNDIKTLLKENEAKEKVIKKQDYVINELSDFVIKIYKKEMNKTSDWWFQEELCTSFDDINLATNFRLEKELKEEK